MKETMSLLHSEWLKIQSTKAFRVSMVFMLLLVPAVSWLEGRQYLSIGLDATPETVPGLAEAIDPLGISRPQWGFYGKHGFGHLSWNFGSYGISVS